MRIDCSQCEMYQSEHCEDCLVTAVLHPSEGPVEIDEDLDPPLQELVWVGLIPVLKFRPKRSETNKLRPDRKPNAAEAG